MGNMPPSNPGNDPNIIENLVQSGTDLQRLMYAHYRAVAVKRYHCIRVIHQETIAGHVGAMLGLAFATYKTPSMDLLQAIAFHDHAEFRTGDSPSDEKKRRPALKAQLDLAENEVLSEWDIPYPEGLDPTDVKRLKVLDVLSGISFCLAEFQMGNRAHISVMKNYLAYFSHITSYSEAGDRDLEWASLYALSNCVERETKSCLRDYGVHF